MRVNDGMPFESNLDRHGRRLFDLNKVEAWLDGGRARPTTMVERLSALESEVKSLTMRLERIEERCGDGA